MSTEDHAAAAPDIDALKAYTRAKQMVAEEIRTLHRALEEGGRDQDLARCQELMVKLAEDRFTLAVVGQFKRGKSSLMNAILGHDLLPTGILPLTSAITILQYGPRETLVVERDRALFAENVSVDRLADYVTEKGNPGNHKRVRAARIEIPSPFLRQGLEFVDTPGIGSVVEANEATTYAFLPQCDAVLFVTGVDGPLSTTEVDFLDRVREHVRKIFFVVNKTDLLGGSEREEVLAFVAAALAEHVDIHKVSIHPLSSRLGLEAKRGGDSEGYARSGLKGLEESLAAYLSGEKASTFLVSILDRALALVAGSERDGNGGENRLEDGMASRLEALRRRLQDGKLLELRRRSAISAVDVEGRSLPTSSSVPGRGRTIDVATDLRARGCPVCQHVWKEMFDFFAEWQHALWADPDAQTAFAADVGFCPFHTWQLVQLASPQGLSRGYPRLADRISEDLARLAQEPGTGRQDLERILQHAGGCRACQFRQEVEGRYVRRLAEFLSSDEGRVRYGRSQGVCLRHLVPLLDAVEGDETAGFLLMEAARHFEELAEDMRSYATKRDAVRRGLVNLDEEDAYLRALVHLVGERSFSGPAGQKE